MSFRKVLFWVHLMTGVLGGLVIGIMALTGVTLAFEKEIIAGAERDVRHVTPPSDGAPRLPLDELLAKVREAQPNARPSGMTIQADPSVAVMFNLGRTNTLYANPYTGEIKPQGAGGTRAFMRTMVEWHRFLGGQAEGRRATGKAITGACNLAFLFLAISGLYLWWPRQWTRNALRAITTFNFSLRGKARDWNWHNVIGLWSAPVLIVLTATAAPISYRWATDLIYSLTRSEPPATGMSGVAVVEISKPAPGTKPLGWGALIAVAQKEIPQWEQIILRTGGGPGGGGGRGTNAAANASASAAGSGSGSVERPREGRDRAGAQPVTLAVKERGGDTPRFAATQLTLDPYTGTILRQEKFSDYNLGRRVRSWTRFLHTGEALGPAGQAVAGLASLGGVFLVWTGFALAWRRFCMSKTKSDAVHGTHLDTPGAPVSDPAALANDAGNGRVGDRRSEMRIHSGEVPGAPSEVPVERTTAQSWKSDTL